MQDGRRHLSEATWWYLIGTKGGRVHILQVLLLQELPEHLDETRFEGASPRGPFEQLLDPVAEDSVVPRLSIWRSGHGVTVKQSIQGLDTGKGGGLRQSLQHEVTQRGRLFVG